MSGLFTTDPISGMSWFKPGALEPGFKFELLGLFASLAIYNGVTLPFNFPKVLYRKLLGVPSRLLDLADGWPQLTKGLIDLRNYDGDVEETFLREYVFSVDVFGTTVNVDMSRDSEDNVPPSRTRGLSPKLSPRASSGDGKEGPESSKQRDIQTPTKPEKIDPGVKEVSSSDISDNLTDPQAPMVTNANRDQYISDYIDQLTNVSIATQYAHFTKGFFRCITPKSLTLFTPSQLKTLVEGSPTIDVARLRRFTKYAYGYDCFHPTITSFWRIVQRWDQEKLGRLLEFVTASDRLPIGGEARVNFVIQKNGEGDERLPTSITCFGKLLLPVYKGEEAMERALELAVAHAKGFGVR